MARINIGSSYGRAAAREILHFTRSLPAEVQYEEDDDVGLRDEPEEAADAAEIRIIDPTGAYDVEMESAPEAMADRQASYTTTNEAVDTATREACRQWFDKMISGGWWITSPLKNSTMPPPPKGLGILMANTASIKLSPVDTAGAVAPGNRLAMLLRSVALGFCIFFSNRRIKVSAVLLKCPGGPGKEKKGENPTRAPIPQPDPTSDRTSPHRQNRTIRLSKVSQSVRSQSKHKM